MTVLPGSLDYLYHNGIIDHIPYEAYEMTPMTPSGRAQLSGMGMGYSYSMPQKDVFVPQAKYSVAGQNEKSYREQILEAALDTDKPNKNESYKWVKGLLSAGILLITGVCLTKGLKSGLTKIKNANFWSKLNPKTWFKK